MSRHDAQQIPPDPEDDWQATLAADDGYAQWLDSLEKSLPPYGANEPEKAMSLTARDNGGGDFKKLPPGAHFAICNMIVDCGLQPGYQGKSQHKIYVRWEVPDERVEYVKKDGSKHEGPMTIGRFYTLSLSEKAQLRADLENWRGLAFTDAELKGFDVFKVLGKPCQLQVVHAESGGKTYANVNGIMSISKDQKARAKTVRAENPLLSFSLESPDPEMFDVLPEWLQKKITERIKDTASAPPSGHGNTRPDFDDDIPF